LLPTLPLCEIMLLVLYMCIRCSGGLSAREYNGGLSDENVPIYIYIYIDNTLVVEIQKGILLYSCHIVRKFLNIDTQHNTQQSQNAEARRR
jgi:hypothetical protein